MSAQNLPPSNAETEPKKKGMDSRTFRIILVLSLVCTVISFIFRIQSKPVEDISYTLADVNQVLDEQLQGWNEGNIDKFMQGYIKDSSVRFITNKRVKTSWQEITDSYKKNYPNKDVMGQLSFYRDEVRWINESAYIAQVIGRWQVVQKHKETAKANGSVETNGNSPSTHNIIQQNNNSQDTLSGRFSLIFIGTPEGPKIQIDHTW